MWYTVCMFSVVMLLCRSRCVHWPWEQVHAQLYNGASQTFHSREDCQQTGTVSNVTVDFVFQLLLLFLCWISCCMQPHIKRGQIVIFLARWNTVIQRVSSSSPAGDAAQNQHFWRIFRMASLIPLISLLRDSISAVLNLALIMYCTIRCANTHRLLSRTFCLINFNYQKLWLIFSLAKFCHNSELH